MLILDPGQLDAGGEGDCKPKWVDAESYRYSWQTHYYQDTKLNCGIYSAYYGLADCNHRNGKNHQLTIKKKTLQCQLQTGLGERMFVCQFQTIIDRPEFDHKRIIIVFPSIRDFSELTFTGKLFGEDVPQGWHPKHDTIFIAFDGHKKHFGAIQSAHCVNNTRFCHFCLASIRNDSCHCTQSEDEKQERIENNKRRAQNRSLLPCKSCEAPRMNSKSVYCNKCHPCQCGYTGKFHRCLSIKIPNPDKVDFVNSPEECDQGKCELWIWDIESSQEFLLKDGQRMTISSIAMTDEGYVWGDDGKPLEVVIDRKIHNAMLIVAYSLSGKKLVFNEIDDEEGTVLERFVNYMTTHNGGNNRLYAHNSSGYDTRMLYQALCHMRDPPSFNQINRGTKFIQLRSRKTVFCDSMLLMPGSLARLANEFFPSNEPIHFFPYLADETWTTLPPKEKFGIFQNNRGFNEWYASKTSWDYKTELELHCGDKGLIRKGHFPHLFNTRANYHYVGKIPDIEYFCLATSIKNEEQLIEFKLWHKYQRIFKPVWDFQKELVSYCENDVDILLKIMVELDLAMKDMGNPVSPCHYPTLASYVNTVLRMLNYPTLELEEDIGVEEKNARIDDLSWNKSWAVLKDFEYWFARPALYGGRTDTRHIYHNENLNEHGKETGEKYEVRSVDVVSLYPSVQLNPNLAYPTGLPIITIYDKDATPCIFHPRTPCLCVRKEFRVNEILQRGYKIEFKEQPTIEEIMDDSFFGIVEFTYTPPRNLIHPVLPRRQDGKCVFSLEKYRGTYCTPELKAAIRAGYRIDQVHRLDKYHLDYNPPWVPLLQKGYSRKCQFGGKNPTPEKQEQLIRAYEHNFGMGDIIKNSFPWVKKPALKFAAKIFINCCWGKECQNPKTTECLSFGAYDDDEHLDTLYQVERGIRH